jgi:hypothetical protein
LPSYRDPEAFHIEKSAIEHALPRLACCGPAQERGEVADLGLTRKQVHEVRQIREAEQICAVPHRNKMQ